jgi:hypothetical protein
MTNALRVVPICDGLVSEATCRDNAHASRTAFNATRDRIKAINDEMNLAWWTVK